MHGYDLSYSDVWWLWWWWWRWNRHHVKMALESRDSRNYVIFNRQPDCRCRFHGGFKPSSWFSWLFPFASMHPYIHPCIHASIHRYWLVQFSFLHIHTILHIDGWWICTGRQMDEQTEIQRSWLLVASSLPPHFCHSPISGSPGPPAQHITRVRACVDG